MSNKLADRITRLDGQQVLEACKNFRLGLAHEARQRSGEERSDPGRDVESIRSLDLEGDASSLRAALLDETKPDQAVELGRLTLLVAAEHDDLKSYVEGAVDGVEMGVRAVDPISILTIAAAIYMIGRLLPSIEIKREPIGAEGQARISEIKITPIKDPLAGLADVIKAVPTLLGRG